jgi:hypothetical protein
LDKVIAVLDECCGALIIGVPQVLAHDAEIKGTLVPGLTQLGTEWNHIEAGLAYGRNLPLLVVHHDGVTRGVFDPGTFNAYIYKSDLRNPGWSLTPNIHGALKEWLAECVPDPKASSGAVSSKPVAPRCPSCSKSLLNPVPQDFRIVEGADWECPRCGFKGKVN